MQLEEYFEFVSAEDIRIKGYPLRLDALLESFLEGHPPEEIARLYPGLGLERIYAAITYYLHYRAEMDAYLARMRQRRHRLGQWQVYSPGSSDPQPIQDKALPPLVS